MYEKFGKRGLDIMLATALIILTLPLFIVISLAIKLSSRGPAVFKQERTGLNGKTFTMRKFRSMTKDNNVLDSNTDDRITRIGKILRATSLDELPQFINILNGDMSFIGPRPWITEYYTHMNTDQRRRNSVRPGITGLAQVCGRNTLTIHEKIDYDLQYVDVVSLRGDMKVVLATLRTIFDHGAHQLGKGGIHEELETLKCQDGSV